MIDYSARVKKTMNYINARLGSIIVYKRFKEMGEWNPQTGYSPTYWETPTLTATVHGAEEDEIDRSGGRLQVGDVAFSFLADAFTNQGTSGTATDLGAPRAGDVIIYARGATGAAATGATGAANTWYTDLGEGEMVCKLDITSSTYTVYGRRKEA